MAETHTALVRAFLWDVSDIGAEGAQAFLDLDQVAAARWNNDFDEFTVYLKSGQTLVLPMDAGNAFTAALAERAALWEI